MRACLCLLSLLLIAGCFATTPKCQYELMVDKLKTTRDFHYMVLKPDFFSRGYPGYLVGLEKVNTKVVGGLQTGNCPNNGDAPCLDVDAPFYRDKKEVQDWLKKRIGFASTPSRNIKSIFPTHIARYGSTWDGITPEQKSKIEQIEKDPFLRAAFDQPALLRRSDTISTLGRERESDDRPRLAFEQAELLFNVYGTGCAKQKASPPLLLNDLYAESWKYVRMLKTDLAQMVDRRNVTHVFIFAMGWNTPQWEALANFHDIFRNVSEAAFKDRDGDKFRPVFIGITWPSYWEDKKIAISDFPNKRNDADEIGLTFANLILQEVVGGVQKEKPGLKIVLVGHSLGARLVTRAADSGYLLSPEPTRIDLLIGLEGAFSAEQFLDTGYGKFLWGFSDLVRHSFYTSSDRDTATSAPSIVSEKHFVGSIETIRDLRWGKLADEKDVVNGTWRNPTEVFSIISLDNQGNVEGAEAVYADSRIDGVRYGIPTNGKVVLVDASEIVNENTPGTGGGAHSDIYSPEMGNFIWTAIKACTIDAR